VLKDFFFVSDTFEAVNNSEAEQVFICSSMDATSHFQQATREVMQIYKAVTGKDVDLNANPEVLGSDAQFE